LTLSAFDVPQLRLISTGKFIVHIAGAIFAARSELLLFIGRQKLPARGGNNNTPPVSVIIGHPTMCERHGLLDQTIAQE
jgi:hypothetical protein